MPLPLVLTHGKRPAFPEAGDMHPDRLGLVAMGFELTPDLVMEAYTKGAFPWEGTPPIPWFSPDPRMIMVPRAFRASKSLLKLAKQGRLQVSFDGNFTGVIGACAGTVRPGEPGTWITPNLIDTYCQLHADGVAHSVEVWEDEQLVGGLYGLAMGRAFFGESMFHTRRDASKMALFALCRRLHGAGYHFIDCQQATSHLQSLGAVPVPRLRYLRLLDEALSHPNRWLEA